MISPIVTAVCKITARIKDSGRFDGPLPVFPAENYLQHEGNGPYESDRVLDAYAAILTDDILGTTERVVSPNTKRKVTVRKVGGQSDWRCKARSVLLEESAITEKNFGIENDSLDNIGGCSRLDLIYGGIHQQINCFRTWKSQTQNADYINRFPAARFMLGGGGQVQCLKHGNWQNAVKRFDDTEFWISMNSPEIGGFGVPWGPFGIDSDFYQRPVNRSEAESLGLVRPGEIIKPVDARRWGAEPVEHVEPQKVPESVKRQFKADMVAQYGPDVLDANGKLDPVALKRKLFGR